MANTMGTSSTGFKMSGLISGLDTEALVKQMSMATKNKINKQQQMMDLLSWKQESYRSVIDKISGFKDTYLNALKPKSYLKSKSLFSTYKGVSSNDAISVIGSSKSGGKSYKITNIEQLATAAKMESSESVTSGVKLNFASAQKDKNYEVQVTLDGLKKTVSFKGGENADITAENFTKAMNNAFGLTGNNFTFNADTNNFNYVNSRDDIISHKFSIGMDKSNGSEGLNAMGLTSEVSNKIDLNTKLKDVNFAEPLQGGSFTFTINNQNFNFDRESTIADVMDKVNNSAADVTMSFNSLSQKFEITAKEQGAGSSIKIKQTNGNLLTSMFGSSVGSSGNISSVSMMSKSITGGNISSTDFSAHKNKSFNVTVNGVTKTIGLWGYDSNGIKVKYENQTDKDGKVTPGIKNTISMLNREMERAFGSGAPKFEYNNSNITIKGSAGDVIKLSESMVDKDGKLVENVTTGTPSVGSKALLEALGFTADKTNQLNETTTLASVYGNDAVKGITLTVGGKSLDITENTTLKEFNDAFASSASVDYKTGIISLKESVTASVTTQGSTVTDANARALVEKMFGSSYESISKPFAPSSGTGAETVINGKNAILTVNGVKITNNSNQIKIDGTTINIEKATADMVGKDVALDVDISTKRDTKDAFDAVVKFVDDYNKMIDELHKEVQTRRPTDNGRISGTKYEPLTEEQREEMTDKEIEKWEEKAKTGLLHNDKDISAFLDKMRRALTKTTADKFSLYDMGITSSTNYKDNGKLEIDEDKLKAAFEKNPEQIQELFTGDDGVINAVENAVEETIGTKGGKYGSLVRIAGIKNTSTQANNNISKQIGTYSDMIENLKDKYEREQERYWKQFTNLEKVMNQYNMQAGWLAEQFGGGMQ